MAVAYMRQRCSCGGRLQYESKQKIWVCPYCGTETVREERYDGLYTIKNVIRQTLLDIANRRLESAEGNCSEAEKIDSRYIGTLIAKMSLLMIMAVTPGAVNQNDRRAVLAQLKACRNMLQAEYPDIGEDEELLYEFLDSSDICATLLLVYDSIGDDKRKTYLAGRLNLSEVYAADTSKALFSYSVKQNDCDTLSKLIKNADNIDTHYALEVLLTKFQDNKEKLENAQLLFEKGAFKQGDEQILTRYIENVADSPRTKVDILSMAAKQKLYVKIPCVLRGVVAVADDPKIVESALNIACSVYLTDRDIAEMVNFALAEKNIAFAGMILDALQRTKQYVAVSFEQIDQFLYGADLSMSDILFVLQKLYDMVDDPRCKEKVAATYLVEPYGDSARRQTTLEYLLSTVDVITVNAFAFYLTGVCEEDGYKVRVVEKLMELDINKACLRSALSKYLFLQIDPPDVKRGIISLLIAAGTIVDPGTFTQYVCSVPQDGFKTEVVQKLAVAGAGLKSNALSDYLMSMKLGAQFNPDVFSVLMNSSFTITEAAMIQYVLYCHDTPSLKCERACLMARRAMRPLGVQSCDISHLGHTLRCNLAQAYLLVATDPYLVARPLVQKMLEDKAQFNAKMMLQNQGTIKLKKYIAENKSELSPLSDQLCTEFKVYNMLF